MGAICAELGREIAYLGANFARKLHLIVKNVMISFRDNDLKLGAI